MPAADNGPAQTLYLDPIGGIAGDMFLAACCDLEPALREVCDDAFERLADRPSDLGIAWPGPESNGGFGCRFRVEGAAADNHTHMPFDRLRQIIGASDLPGPVRDRVDDLFHRLAQCEASAHGVTPEEVVFHEVGGWDSIVDVILSASVIEALGDADWAVGPIPIGSGTVECAHGTIPVPAPATAKLLEGFTVYRDEYPGERVTPTGAAILSHLRPQQFPQLPTGLLLGSGNGFGTRTFDGLPNVLRCYRLEVSAQTHDGDVAEIEFDIDDQTAEDLALALQSLRSLDGVVDVAQTTYFGKKGRLGTTVRVLTAWSERERVADACLAATSTLGVRWHRATRRTLDRSTGTATLGNRTVAVKRVTRPDGRMTCKIESDDLADEAASYGERETARATATRNETGDDG